jgi:uncharacterized alkaline shock family protein YloU
MSEKNNKHDKFKDIDPREIQLPETVFSRDIESRVIQAIVLQCLEKIEGIELLEGNLIDNLLGRESSERIKGIYVDQEQKKHSVAIKVEVNIHYGVAIPEKSEEIQEKVVQEVTHFTGLHVSSVHVIFKNLVSPFAKEETTEEIVEEEEEALLQETSSNTEE